MDQRVFNDLLLTRLEEFLLRRPPTLDDVLGAVCEVYKVSPDDLDMRSRQADLARAVYIYLSSRATNERNETIAGRIGVDMIEVHRAAITINRRLGYDGALRDDLDLACVRLIERVLLRERWHEPVA